MNAANAFDIEEVSRVEFEAARIVNISGKYEVEFDEEATIDGRKADVKILYPNNVGEIDVYRLNKTADPILPEMSNWLPEAEYTEFFKTAEQMFFRQEEERRESEREAYLERRHHEMVD